jgi:hypothetical protein
MSAAARLQSYCGHKESKAHLLLVLDLRHGAGLDPVHLLGRRGILVPERRCAESRAGVARFPQVRPVAKVVRLVLGVREVRQVVQAQLHAQAGLRFSPHKQEHGVSPTAISGPSVRLLQAAKCASVPVSASAQGVSSEAFVQNDYQ